MGEQMFNQSFRDPHNGQIDCKCIVIRNFYPKKVKEKDILT